MTTNTLFMHNLQKTVTDVDEYISWTKECTSSVTKSTNYQNDASAG